MGGRKKSGKKDKTEYCCRLVAKRIKWDTRELLFATAPPSEAKKVLSSLRASLPGLCLDFIDVAKAYFHVKARRRVHVVLPEGDRQDVREAQKGDVRDERCCAERGVGVQRDDDRGGIHTRIV